MGPSWRMPAWVVRFQWQSLLGAKDESTLQQWQVRAGRQLNVAQRVECGVKESVHQPVEETGSAVPPSIEQTANAAPPLASTTSRQWAGRRVAIVQSPALGDSLVMTIVAHNLQRAGAQVTMFGRQGTLLEDWFPALHMQPALTESTMTAALAEFNTVFQLHDDYPFATLHRSHPNGVFMGRLPKASSTAAMVDRVADYCREDLQLPDVDRGNGMTAPVARQLVHRRHATRVAIHPTASTADKRWLPARFIALGRKLKAAGFEPQFVVTPDERAAWRGVEQAGMTLAVFDSLSDVAAWLYESGWFIGNDSGIGHLASNLQIPTVSLFMRKGIARTWRPSWGVGRVLVGGAYIPTGKLKERLWKYALTVSRVMREFDALRGERG